MCSGEKSEGYCRYRLDKSCNVNDAESDEPASLIKSSSRYWRSESRTLALADKTMIYLASTSPRRTELLQQIDIAHECLAIDIDETQEIGEAPEDYVVRMAQEKCIAGVAMRPSGLSVLAADTTVVIDKQCLGKPVNEEDAFRMLQRLSGRPHEVLSAVALHSGDVCRYRLSRSEVVFREIDAEEIKLYWQTGEPKGKAGAYAIQGRAAVFIQKLTGSYSGVMGLPLMETYQLLREAGIASWVINKHLQ